MKIVRVFFLLSCLAISNFVYSLEEFTVASFNCGGLPYQYDYFRAATMQRIMQKRYLAEPHLMAENENLQKKALKLLFSPSNHEGSALEKIRQTFSEKFSLGDNNWKLEVDNAISLYHVRPPEIYDRAIRENLKKYLRVKEGQTALLSEEMEAIIVRANALRTKIAKEIFWQELNQFDIICFQEADNIVEYQRHYALQDSLFPPHFDYFFPHPYEFPKLGFAWNTHRFSLVKTVYLEDITSEEAGPKFIGKGLIAIFLEQNPTGGKLEKKIAISSGHLTGCSPYFIKENDHQKGDGELRKLIKKLDEISQIENVAVSVIGMDANVTALHPRLEIIRENHYSLDYENFIEPTCTNPYFVLNTRIDWIVAKSIKHDIEIVNIPILNVHLNNLKTNMSDHKPIAAKIKLKAPSSPEKGFPFLLEREN